jgi:hypothetical protein
MENGAVVGFLLAALALPDSEEGAGSAGDGEAFSRERATRDERGDDERLGCRALCRPICGYRRPNLKEDAHARR